MRVWPFNRRRDVEPIDRTGAATVYPNRSGALGPDPVGEQQARQRSGYRWCGEATERLPFYTKSQRRRGGWR
jgi:hypothetical protein